ncbi:MAG: NtaA/DmoA family FMN-dependent monooxygenase [Candidatus Rokubacteria bacterium]|nr:NtaA/DmoA family FMN-dependent monooxygenase [Candidatus Rokubacteria bacterium]
MKRQMHLNLFIHSRGHHEASWRHPAASSLALSDVRYYQALAQRAEAGLFDAIFLADQLALGDDVAHGPRTALEPLTLLAALAVSTSRIGLIATASTTYTEPFNLARQFASLDHISRGRIGWNIVTSWLASAARNYGGVSQVSHAERYARAEEFMTVVKGLWDSWAADAELDDRVAGRYADPSRIRPLNHEGAHYRVAGPLNLPRCPQGRPVLVQAGSSDTGRDFAARHAEAMFTAHLEKETAQAFYADLKKRVADAARDPEQALVLPGLSPLIASSAAEGTGRRSDVDVFDASYLHLFVWDGRANAIAGAYRLGLVDEILARHGPRGLYTHSLFDYGTGLLEALEPGHRARPLVPCAPSISAASPRSCCSGAGSAASSSARRATRSCSAPSASAAATRGPRGG